MKLYYFVPVLILFLVVFISKRKKQRRAAVVRNLIEKRRNGVKENMKELAKSFVGKDVIIYTVNDAQIMGRVAEVGEGALILEREDGSREAINLELTVRLREHPVGKNGKKKSVIFD